MNKQDILKRRYEILSRNGKSVSRCSGLYHTKEPFGRNLFYGSRVKWDFIRVRIKRIKKLLDFEIEKLFIWLVLNKKLWKRIKR